MSTGTLLDRPPDELVQILDPDGRVREDATVPPLSDEDLLEIYRGMRLTRAFDERAIDLQRQGRLGTFPPAAGQEAAQVASTHALSEDDLVVCQYREHGVVVARGIGPEYLRYWRGEEVGNAWLADRNVFPLNITVGGQIPHAVGLAWGARLAGDPRAVACHFGDGATSEGDFHEALNFAGVFDLPAVFICNDNQWAISVPRTRQTASPTLAGKAAAYGMAGIRVDGMDPLAVYEVVRSAREAAVDPEAADPTRDDLAMPSTIESSSGGDVDGNEDGRGAVGRDGPDRPHRPTLVEAVQYRFGAHTTADDPSAYRTDDDVERWRALDPIPRYGRFLRDRGLLDDETSDAIAQAAVERVDELVREAEATPAGDDPDELFAHVYREPSPRIRRQRGELRRLRARLGKDAFTDGP